LLRADNVWFGYGRVPVLRGVSLEIPPGSLLGVLGPNGSGKTTLLRVMAGLLPPSRGRVTLDGQDVARIPRDQLARRIAVVPQETQLAFEYTALEIALMGRYPHLGAFELESPEDVSLARAALAATGTAAFEDRPFSTLSGGEKQRVVIASALAQFGDRRSSAPADRRSRILLLDEPTAALDLGYQLEIADLLDALHRRAGHTITIATHNLELASAVCRTLVLLKDGQVEAAGSAGAVLTPESIRTVYGVEALVEPEPQRGGVRITPLRRIHQDAASRPA
jgi:iron complex transport system ATP-binding protein